MLRHVEKDEGHTFILNHYSIHNSEAKFSIDKGIVQHLGSNKCLNCSHLTL